MGTEDIAGVNANANANVDVTVTDSVTRAHHLHLPRAAPPPQVIIIPATQASTVATNAAKKIRRAFSMPRNPFRWSSKFKTSVANHRSNKDDADNDDDDGGGGGSNSTITSCVGGGRGRAGSIVSLSSYEAVCKDTNGKTNDNTNSDTERHKQMEHMKNNNNNANNNYNNKDDLTTVNGNGTNRILRRSSFRKFLNRIAQHVSSSVGKHASYSTGNAAQMDRVPPIGGYQWPPDQTPGVMGLKNHGNTCFMNAVLQCLSHTDILAEYFVLDQYKADLKRRNKINSRKFGTKGELTEQLANVLKALWTCKNESDHSTAFKAVVDRYGSQFRSSTQHDAQEFLFWLLDKVHEDLNTATKRRYKSMKNTYGRPDEVIAAETLANHIRCNNSFVQAVFQAQFRSSLTCPRCKKQSNTFDPFHCISVQLPQLTQQTIFVTVVYLKQHPRQVKLGLTVSAGSPIVALREQLQLDTGITSERMVLVDLNKEGFTRVFYDTQPVATLNGIETIYCIEMPEVPKNTIKPREVSDEEGVVTVKSNTESTSDLQLIVANVRKKKKTNSEEDHAEPETLTFERFGMPFSMRAQRDCTYTDLQKRLLRELSAVLKPEVFAYATPLDQMFRIRLQDPSADPDTYLEAVEHPLLTEMIDMALSVLSAEAGPPHIKLLLEWTEPEQYFADLTDSVVEHESVARLEASKPHDTAALTLEQCLEHYTKAETLSAEDAWRCPHCQQYLPVVKTLGLWSLPDILVVHFKRFRQHQEKGPNAAKLTTMVKFPLNAFDMSPHLARGIDDDVPFGNALSAPDGNSSQFYRPSPWKKTRNGDNSRSSTLNSRENRETRYDLYAVCYHQGDTLETGHYTAACKNPYDRQWYKFDDQRVTKVPNDSIQEEIINNEAYMLFYQRRNGDATEYSGSSSNSSDHWVSRIAPPAATTTTAAATATPVVAVAEDRSNAADVKPQVGGEVEIEPVPEKAETKPVEIPKVNDNSTLKQIDEFAAAVVSSAQPALAHKVVTQNTNNDSDLARLEQIDFADADADAALEITQEAADDDDEDALQALEQLADKTSPATQADDANQIFVMDEECQINEKANEVAIETTAKSESSNGGTVIKPAASEEEQPAVVEVVTKAEITVNPTKANIAAAKQESQNVPNGNHTPSPILSNGSLASLSTRSAPHDTATAPSVPQKVNGYHANAITNGFKSTSTAPAAITTTNNAQQHLASNNPYKEVLLSSSLKSNNSCIFNGTAEKQQWHGSRSSVSAVENVTQQHVTQHSLNLRHSFSTSSSNYKLRECSETLSMLRQSANTCSKDTLIFIDQQSHHHHHHHHRHHHHHSLMEDDDDTSFMGSRSLWISPVTPHKLITVSPKN